MALQIDDVDSDPSAVRLLTSGNDKAIEFREILPWMSVTFEVIRVSSHIVIDDININILYIYRSTDRCVFLALDL